MSNQIETPVGQLIWANLDKPEFKKNFTDPNAGPAPGEKPKYRLSMIFGVQAQQDPLFAEMDRAMVAEAASSFGRRAEPFWPLKAFDESKRWAGFQAGDVFLNNASSLDRPPLFIFEDGKRKTTDRTDLFFPGAGVKALISFVGFTHKASGSHTVLCNVHALLLMDPSLPRIAGGSNVVDEDVLSRIAAPKYVLPPPGQAGQVAGPRADAAPGPSTRFHRPSGQAAPVTPAQVDTRRRHSPG